MKPKAKQIAIYIANNGSNKLLKNINVDDITTFFDYSVNILKTFTQQEAKDYCNNKANIFYIYKNTIVYNVGFDYIIHRKEQSENNG